MDSLHYWVAIPQEVPSKCVFMTSKIQGFTLNMGLLPKRFPLFNYGLFWLIMMIYDWNVGVFFDFDENVSWTHDFPFFLNCELWYGLIDDGSLTIDYVYIDYVVESG